MGKKNTYSISDDDDDIEELIGFGEESQGPSPSPKTNSFSGSIRQHIPQALPVSSFKIQKKTKKSPGVDEPLKNTLHERLKQKQRQRVPVNPSDEMPSEEVSTSRHKSKVSTRESSKEKERENGKKKPARRPKKSLDRTQEGEPPRKKSKPPNAPARRSTSPTKPKRRSRSRSKTDFDEDEDEDEDDGTVIPKNYKLTKEATKIIDSSINSNNMIGNYGEIWGVRRSSRIKHKDEDSDIEIIELTSDGEEKTVHAKKEEIDGVAHSADQKNNDDDDIEKEADLENLDSDDSVSDQNYGEGEKEITGYDAAPDNDNDNENDCDNDDDDDNDNDVPLSESLLSKRKTSSKKKKMDSISASPPVSPARRKSALASSHSRPSSKSRPKPSSLSRPKPTSRSRAEVKLESPVNTNIRSKIRITYQQKAKVLNLFRYFMELGEEGVTSSEYRRFYKYVQELEDIYDGIDDI
ncbi:unnamed protein product [Ambrosiozyma monospora]|uniref:Unnamed protein product n=1 Tax=Ambrosiozyma monospora TaxID=43982 RepID=A0A9W6YW97_AMBMO|nr:unnamed protein product [Ambrosiozyma monospora]